MRNVRCVEMTRADVTVERSRHRLAETETLSLALDLLFPDSFRTCGIKLFAKGRSY